MNNIIKRLSSELELKSDVIEESEELTYFNDFFNICSTNNPVSLFNARLSELLIIYFSSIDNGFSFEEVQNKILDISDDLDTIPQEEFTILYNVASFIVSSSLVDDLTNYFSNKDKSEKEMKKYVLNKLKENIDKHTFVKPEAKNNYEKYCKFLEEKIVNYMFSRTDVLDEILCISQLMKTIDSRNFLDFVRGILLDKKDLSYGFSVYDEVTGKDKYNKFSKISTKHLKEKYNCSTIINELAVISKHHSTLIDDHRKKCRENNKLRYNYETLIKKLNIADKQEEITNVQELIDLANKLDIDIEIDLLKVIAKHNSVYYSKLQFEYNEIKSKSGIEYIDVFSKYNLTFLSFNKEQQENIMNINVIEIDKILSLLDSMKIEYKDRIYDILMYSDSDTLKNISTYIKLRVIDRNFFNNNIDICYSDKYNLFTSNLKIIVDFGINVLKLVNSPEILLYDNNVIKDNLDIIKEYSLNITSRNMNNYKFLSDVNLVTKIDFIIELGLENLLLSDPSILNYDMNVFKRVKVAKSVGYEYFSDGKISENIISKFFVNDCNLDLYLNNSVEYYMDTNYNFSNERVNIDEYRYSNLSYNINGIFISKNKVIRNFNVINSESYNDKLFKSIITGSILNNDEIESIKEVFDSKIKKID